MSRREPTFGEWLAATRDANGKTRQQIAAAIGCTRQTIPNWESDAQIPRDSYLALANALHMRKSELALAAGKF
jgi:transcriptional regulator with XRE-family HTH domain